MRQCRIRFTTGENKGDCHPLPPEQVVSIGRSHANTIRVSASDVSGRHLIIRTDRGGNSVAEVLSSRITRLNEKDVNIGDQLELSPGDSVQMGEDTVFVIEQSDNGDGENTCISDEEKTVPVVAPAGESENRRTQLDRGDQDTVPAASGDDTVPVASGDDTVPVASGEGVPDETLAFQTRAASDEELDNIKKAYRVKRQRKVFLIAFPIVLFFVLAVVLYFYLKPRSEEFVTWPKDKQGNFLNGFQQTAPYLAIVYPKAAGCVVQTKDGVTEIETRIGKFQDVRLHMIVTGNREPATLLQDHPAAFEAWMEKMRDREPTISFGGDRSTVFLNCSRGAGIPLSFVSCTRRVGNDDFWGIASFLRSADNIHTMMIEIPVSEKWRGERFLRSQIVNMVIYAIRRSEEHWEGAASYRRDSAVANDLYEAGRFMEREAPVYWGRIFYLLRSALIKSAAAGDQEAQAQARKMLVKLREQQTIWYNTQKLAYQYADRNGDRGTMNSIQSTAESVFSAEFQHADFRYDLIKRKDWK